MANCNVAFQTDCRRSNCAISACIGALIGIPLCGVSSAFIDFAERNAHYPRMVTRVVHHLKLPRASRESSGVSPGWVRAR